VHDLAVLRHPEWFNRWTASYSRIAVPRVVAAADRLIAVSEHTRRELAALLDVDDAKIRVVPNAVEDAFTPDGPQAEGDYVLAVGTLEPRKNSGPDRRGRRRRAARRRCAVGGAAYIRLPT